MYIFTFMFISFNLDCTGSADLVLVIDSSGSVGKHNFQHQLEFFQDFIQHLDIDRGHVRIALVIFSENVTVELYFSANQTQRSVSRAIQNAHFMYGSTNMVAALRTVKDDVFSGEHGDRPDVQNVCIFITDGVSNLNNLQTVPVARELRYSNILFCMQTPVTYCFIS